MQKQRLAIQTLLVYYKSNTYKSYLSIIDIIYIIDSQKKDWIIKCKVILRFTGEIREKLQNGFPENIYTGYLFL
jgi:hypothetical protein